MKSDNEFKVIKQLKFSDNQKHFIDFIIIVAFLSGIFSVVGYALAFCGVVQLETDIYFQITYFVLVVLSLIYLLVLKILRIKKK